MHPQIVSALIALAGTLAGLLISYVLNSKEKRIVKMQQRIDILTREVRARQTEETIACQKIAELSNTNEKTVKINLRDKTEIECGIRPSMSPSSL